MTTNDTRGRVDPRRVVQGYYDALDADDIDAVLAAFSGDVLYRRPGYDRIVGLEALRRYYASDRKLAPGRHVVRSMLVDGNEVAAHGQWEGELREGGRRSVGFAAFFTIDGNGRIASHTTYFHVPAV
ncbi:nuclear transport factor 2 family protein [Agilicoccus flavus]|uniref:nuclear transport factor 2 family protein n=1 Tax=Agilicoccus flavus TaxID=2775968 RepID=UPI001CF6F668|nr:nuclear transport factor 2 family protein [Agilicoccus flavus]